MTHKEIRIPRDTAVEIMNELGKLEDAIEFIDLTKDDLEAKKNFGSTIQRCDEMEKKLFNFEKITEIYNEKFVKYQTYRQFLSDLEQDERLRDRRFGSTYFDLAENEVIEDEKKILELIDSYNQINENLESLIEKKSVFDKSSQLVLANQEPGALSVNTNMNLGHGLEEGFKSDLNFIAGVIKAEDDLRMKRMIFRISKGRAIPTFFDLITENKLNKVKIQKKIFTIFFQGGLENVLLAKLLKVCDIFGASRFTIPKREEIQPQINLLQNEIYEKKTFLKQAETSIKDFIRDKIGNEVQAAKYELYRLYFKKERAIYQNLNKCIVRGNFIDGEVWIPELKFSMVQEALKNISKDDHSKLTANFSNNQDAKDRTPPTYMQSNDLTAPFQQIVDTYGIPRYREVNPALFAIVTFPFLFGVMFGDIGHGLLLFLFGLYLVLQKDEICKSGSPLKPALKARYLLLFMGFFAFYCGWMYNDFLSLPLGVFGTCYKNEEVNGEEVGVRINESCVYPFGLDPKWYVAKNELAFFNSLKMKISVILGVSQMLFGIVLKGFNAIYFNNMVDFIFEFIPQIIFMGILFGYMIIMIICKWLTHWVDTSRAPSIISLLMSIFLKGGSVGDEGDKKPVWGIEDYTKQESFHFVILIVCGICVPLMLFPKPIMQYLKANKEEHKEQGFNKFIEDNENAHSNHLDSEERSSRVEKPHAAHHGHDSFGEIFVHQAIETIEFVLGAVSNTASYLRLWALSLAHAQLAKVFFEKTLLGGILSGNIIMIVIGFFIFANITFAVLMCMDLMECFLHTLRLHWVEFQNKFYKADGYKFNPYCFKYLVEQDE